MQFVAWNVALIFTQLAFGPKMKDDDYTENYVF